MTAATAAMMFGSMTAPASADRFHVWASFPEPADVVVALSSGLHARDAAQGMENMKAGSNGSTLVGRHAKVLSEDEVREFVADALEKVDRTAKELARDADTTPPAIKNWRDRRNTMSLTNFVRLCRAHPIFRAAVRELLALESALDPRTEAKLVELQRALAETLDRRP